GHARIAWTSEHAGADDVAVLAVATRSDADLRALYQWWTTVPGPTASRREPLPQSRGDARMPDL
ncbi:MAG TPA: hypothetical protein VIK61_12560, partial [Acidimicrobiia bacterium]